jgi:hypothetical protein
MQDSQTFELAEKIYLALKAAGCGIGNASIHIIQRELLGAASVAPSESERPNFVKPTEPGDNYETRMLHELNQLTGEMVWNRRRVRIVTGELQKLWDAAGEVG